jgi:CCR4-NOT transcription complex subunit 6
MHVERFTLVEKDLIEFNQMALQRPDFPKTDTIFNRLLTKDNIAVLTLLQSKQSGSKLLVANTHIHWDPTYSDVKIVQTSMLIEEIESCLKKYSGGKGSNFSPSSCPIPAVICGDFNSTPDSGVFEFMSRGKIKEDHADFGEHSYGNYTEDGITHKFNFKSAYSHVGELRYTNYTAKFKGVIDYIWYSAQALSIVGLLGDIPKDYFKHSVGFPNAHFPSE